MDFEKYLGKTVKYKGSSARTANVKMAKVVGYDSQGLIIYSKELEGNNAFYYGSRNTNWSIEHEKTKAENYWWTPVSNVKIHNDFKEVFNKLKKKETHRD